MYVNPETVINSANETMVNATRTLVSAQKSYMDIMVDNFEQMVNQQSKLWGQAAEQMNKFKNNA